MSRLVLMVALLISQLAPFQCGSTRDPNLRREDTAGDGLWELAERFRAEKNEAARRDTLKFLVERYPSSRHAPFAREELGDAAPPQPK
jgi:hypothetical protein